MKPDITSKKDIRLIIEKFYDKLLADDKMMPFFKEIVDKNHLEEHLDSISDFWSDILLDTHLYTTNVMKKHIDKNVLITFKKEHFVIWVSYFFEAIDTYFEGEKAHSMKNRARSIATVMELKMNVHQ